MLRLAWRNVWRNGRRSAITVLTMAVGLTAVMFGQSLILSLQHQLVEKATSSMAGHLQVQEASIKDYKFPDKYIEDTGSVEAALKAQPGVKVFAKRVNITGLISSPTQSAGVMICGIEPGPETRITTLQDYLVEGEFLGSQPRGIVMGEKLARKLDLRLGEKAVVMAQASDGSMGAEALRLVGVFRSGSESFDGQIVYLPLKAAQEILAVGDKVNHFVARLDRLEDADRVKEELAARLKGKPVQVLTWKEVDHEIPAVQRFQNAILDVVLAIVFVIVSLGVLNTLLMSLFERVREFGVLMAIGARPSWVIRLVLFEALCLGVVGTALGAASGAFLIGHFRRTGLHLPVGEALSYFLPFPSVIFFHFAWGAHAKAALAILATALLAAVPPALRAGRMRPAEALRHV